MIYPPVLLLVRDGDAATALFYPAPTDAPSLSFPRRGVESTAGYCLLDEGPNRGLDLARADELKPVALAVPANLPVDLLGHRPGLVAARWRVEAAALEATDAEYDYAVAAYNTAIVGAANEVAGLLSRLKSIRAQLEIRQGVLRNAQHSWDDATLRYRSGLGTELDTLTVRHQLLSAEQNFAALRSREADISVQLIDALGGGFLDEDAAHD